MSNTRHAVEGSPLRQERYMSSVEYEHMRGLSGGAVAAKVSYLKDTKKRSLLLFLQALSMQPGGLSKVAQDLITQYAKNLGTPTMHKLGMGSARTYNAREVEAIRDELRIVEHECPLRSDYDGDAPHGDVTFLRAQEFTRRKEAARQLPDRYPAAHLVNLCRNEADAGLETFLTELCINPAIDFSLSGSDQPRCATLPYMRDVIGALLDYQERHAEQISADFAETEVSRRLFDVFRHAQHRAKIYIVEGDTGLGKSKAGSVWCGMHAGEARFIDVKGITNKTEFFRTVCRALGLPATYTRNMSDLKPRLEENLKQTNLLLVIDEAHHLLPASERVYAQPELINWIYTMTNSGVSIVLLTTSMFAERIGAINRQITWNLGQVQRRVNYIKLPGKLSDGDIQAVALKLLPGVGKAAVTLAAGYAVGAEHQLTVLSDIVGDAKYAAGQRGGAVTFDDIKAAANCVMMNAAQVKKAFTAAPTKRGRKAIVIPFQASSIDSSAEMATMNLRQVTPDLDPELTSRRRSGFAPELQVE